MYLIFAVFFALVVTTCQPGTAPRTSGGAEGARMAVEGVVLTTDRQAYAAADPVRLTLRNEAGEQLGINLCLSTLEVRQGTQWVRAPQQSEDICTSILRILEPGESDSETVQLPPALPPGEYRFSTEVERIGTGQRRPHGTNAFRVG
jgi:hypothetical protein